MDYRENIICMINGIKNPGILEYLNTFIKLFLEKWGVRHERGIHRENHRIMRQIDDVERLKRFTQ